MIESYDFGRIVINGVTYTRDVMILGDRVETNWWRREGHALQVSDIMQAFEKFDSKVIIVGTGYVGAMKVPKQTMEYFQSKGIEILVEKTKKACDLYNALSKTKRTLAGLHLTC